MLSGRRNFIFFDDDPDKGGAKADEKEYTEAEILQMDEEQLGKLPDEPPEEKPPEEPKEPEEPKDPEAPPVEGKKPEDGDGPPEEPKESDEPKPDDVKAGLTKINQRLSDLDRREAEIDKKLRANEFKDFQVLNDEEKEVLKEEDPEAFNLYDQEEKKYQEFQKEAKELDQKEWNKTQSQEIAHFLADKFDLDLDKDTDGSLQKISEGLKDENSDMRKVFSEVNEFCQDNFRPQNKIGDNPVFSAKQYARAYQMLHFDEIVYTKLSKERENILSSINDAGENASVFDKGVSGDGNKSGIKDKLDDYSQEELLQMDDKTLDAICTKHGIHIPS